MGDASKFRSQNGIFFFGGGGGGENKGTINKFECDCQEEDKIR